MVKIRKYMIFNLLCLANAIDHELVMTTISTSNTITESDKQTVLSLDDIHRLEIYQHSLKQKLYLCSLGWDDNDAGVLCKSLNKTWIGNAIFVDKLLDIPTLPTSLNCDGHESSLLACNFTVDENGCNTTTVAGAVCCQGVAVGVPVGITGMICIIFAVIFIRRRSVHSNLVIENVENRTRTGETSRIQETGLYECTNATAARLSDHTHDPLESEERNCRFIDSKSQNENKESLTGNREKSTIPENYCYESTNVATRLSDHTYDLIESAEYYNMTNVSVPSAK